MASTAWLAIASSEALLHCLILAAKAGCGQSDCSEVSVVRADVECERADDALAAGLLRAKDSLQ
jgi:hypothetical protein